MVIYFSGTGNSRRCAVELAEALSDELVDCSSYIRQQIAGDFHSGTPWVFVAPTYAWQLPRVFMEFLRTSSFTGSEDAYFVMTCGGEIGNAAQSIRTRCQEMGKHFRGVLEVVMPENYVAMFPVPDEQEQRELLALARPKVREAAAWIAQKLDFPEHPVGLRDRLKSGPVNRAFYRFIVKADAFCATDRCISCGKCVERCVLHNITLEQGRPVWGSTCTHCMACIGGCPTQAIEYGKKTRGKRRYWLET